MIKTSLKLSAFLLLLTTTSCSQESSNTETVEDNTTTSEVAIDKATEENFAVTGKVAYFNLDSLNGKVSIYKDFEAEIEASAVKAQQKIKKKEAEINNWRNKWASKGQLLSSEEEKYMQEAQKIQQDAAMFEQNVQMQVQQEQSLLMQRYALRLSGFIKIFAESNGYDAVEAYQFGQVLWYYNPALDITNDLAKIMNDDYSASTVTDSEEQ